MGLFAPRTFNQIMKDMLARLLASTPLTDVNFGSIWTTMLEAAAQEDDEQYFQMFEIIRGYSLDTISSADLDSRAEEYSIEREDASEATTVVTIGDTAITKVSTGVYAGLSGPPAGATTVNGNSATGFAVSGSVVIGRGTPNSETVPYNSITTFPNYVRFNLGASTTKDHGTDETIILSQGGDRTVAALTVVTVPASDTTEEIQFELDQAATILDGESEVTLVPVTALVAGSSSNVPIGSIQTFASLPFSTATVRNPFRVTNGIDDETDQELRDRIKSTIQSLSRGTGRAITTGILGLVSTDDNKRVVSLSLRDTTDPAEVVKLFVDDGTGFIPSFAHVGLETVVASATGGEKFLQVANFPLVKAFVETASAGPYNIAANTTLFVEVNGKTETVTFLASDFEVLGAASTQEVLRKINASAQLFEARVSSEGTKIRIFARANSGEEIRVTGGTANGVLDFQTDQKFTAKLFLERNRVLTLLNKDGQTAFVESGATGAYNVTTGPFHLSLVIDGKINNVQKVWFNPASFATPASVSVLDAAATVLAQTSGLTAEASSNNTRFTLGSLTARSLSSKIRVLADFTTIFNEESGVNINRTIEMKTSGTNVQMFATNSDYLYLGHDEVPFDSVFVKLAVLASASINPVFEYWNGTVWTAVGVHDGTSGFSASGHILFQAPYNWAKTAVEGETAYWFRIQRTNAGLATPPTESRVRICGANEIFLFSQTEAVGANRDYRMNRYVGQIELETPLIANDKVTLGSMDTRAFTTSASGNYNGLVGQTLTVKVDGVSRSVTFVSGDFSDVTAATPAEVAAAISDRMLGVTASVVGGTRVKIQTNRYNTGTVQAVTGGANSVLAFPTTLFGSFVSHSPALESAQGPWTLLAGANLIVIVDDNFAATFTVPLYSERTLTAATTTVLTDPSLNTTFPGNDDIAGFDALITNGAQAGSRRTIMSYVAATGAVTLTSPLGGAPMSGNKFQILPVTAPQAVDMLNNKQITLLSTKAEIKASDSGRRLQLASLLTSEDSAIAVSGGTANTALLFSSEARGIDAYRYFTGLAQLVQWTVDGRVDDPDAYPGIRAAGVQIEVLEPVTVPVEVALTITTEEGVALSSISNNVKSAVSNYINRLAVGADVVRSNIIVAVRGVSGVFDVEVTTPTENIAIADNELARISDGDISVV